jgi:hypothetical protein
MPFWMERVNPTEKDRFKTIYLQRNVAKLGRFILDDLNDILQHEQDKQLERVEDCFKSCRPHCLDKDLDAPRTESRARAIALDKAEDEREQEMRLDGWRPRGAHAASRKAGEPRPKGMLAEYNEIDKHVRAIFDEHKVKIASIGTGKQKDHRFTELSIQTRQDILRSVSRSFDSFPPREDKGFNLKFFSYREAVRVRASIAYYYAWHMQHGPSRFPWDVAMRELCDIKAKVRPGWRPIFGELHDVIRVRKF